MSDAHYAIFTLGVSLADTKGILAVNDGHLTQAIKFNSEGAIIISGVATHYLHGVAYSDAGVFAEQLTE
jgi:hypothetical protein